MPVERPEDGQAALVKFNTHPPPESSADAAVPSLKSVMPQKHGSARNMVLAG
jgi:hypothetical protein